MNTSKTNERLLSRRHFLNTAFIAGASGLLLPRVSGVALAAEPTLDETLSWLKEKIEGRSGEWGRYSVTLLDVTKGQMVIERHSIDPETKDYYSFYEESTLFFNKIAVKYYNNDQSRGIYIDHVSNWTRYPKQPKRDANTYLFWLHIGFGSETMNERVLKAFEYAIKTFKDQKNQGDQKAPGVPF